MYFGMVYNKSLGENKILIKDEEYLITPNIQESFIITRLTTKPMHNEDKSIVFNIIGKTCFYTITLNKGLSSARMKDPLYKLPKAIEKIRNPLLSLAPSEGEAFEEEGSDNLDGQGVKITILFNIIDFYTGLEILLVLKQSNHTDILREASSLMDELYKRADLQTEQQHRNALDKFHT